MYDVMFILSMAALSTQLCVIFMALGAFNSKLCKLKKYAKSGKLDKKAYKAEYIKFKDMALPYLIFKFILSLYLLWTTLEFGMYQKMDIHVLGSLLINTEVLNKLGVITPIVFVSSVLVLGVSGFWDYLQLERMRVTYEKLSRTEAK